MNWEKAELKDSGSDTEGDWWLEQYASVSIEEIDAEIAQYEKSLQDLYSKAKTECDADFLFWFDTDVCAINHDMDCLVWVKKQKMNQKDEENDKFNVGW